MAIKFSETAGEAKKGNIDFYKYSPGVNKFRMVGDVLARYVYWLETNQGKPASVECLGFDREQERFTNLEKDWVLEYFPDIKCSWSYVIQGLDANDGGKVKVIPLKKKMFGQIVDAAKKLKSDPTDIEKGFWVTVDRKKTGPLAYNVEYTVDILQCKDDIGALSAEDKALVADLKPIDELFTRPSSEDQKKFITERILSQEDEKENAAGELAEFDEDVPQ